MENYLITTKRGLHNWRNLFRKPNLLEWTILFMLIMVLFITWAYQRDTALCRELIDNFEDKACQVCGLQIKNATNPMFNEENPNYSAYRITGELTGENR